MNGSIQAKSSGVNQAGAGRKTAAGGLACAVLMPHAPILVPEIGGERVSAAEASCRAMREVAAWVVGHQPESLVVVSPHSPRKQGAFGLWAEDRLHGSFAQFGASQVEVDLPNDGSLAKAIVAEAQARNLETWEILHHSLDHGALVPLWFLVEAGWSGPTVVLSLDYPEAGGLFEMGEAIAAAADALPRRLAVIASGDMSHRLTKGAPCGFHPRAQEFDTTFIQLVRDGAYAELGRINPDLRELAAEDAVDSTLMAASAVKWNATGHRILNYEGPFGVGYGVAILFANESNSGDDASDASHTASPEGAVLPAAARQSVEAALRGSAELPPEPTSEYLQARHGVFVTLHDRSGRLRGCVGTLNPVCLNLLAETWRSARLAALEDTRFPPVKARELPNLRFSVSVLHSIEDVASTNELDPAHYGVMVSTDDGRSGLLLPNLADIQTVEQQLALTRRKGGIGPDEPVKVQRFQVDRFEEPLG